MLAKSFVHKCFTCDVASRLKAAATGGSTVTCNCLAARHVVARADWKSAIRQVGNLRYLPSSIQPCLVHPGPTSEFDLTRRLSHSPATMDSSFLAGWV